MKPNKRTIERYYAIRIGTPGKHWPYFKTGPDNETPHLFGSREAAERECPKQPDTQVVVVRVCNP